MALCNVQTLMDRAACFACMPPGMQQAIELQLLCEILAINTPGGGGTPTSQEVFPGHYGNVEPGFVPTANHAIAPDLDAPFEVWVWNPDTSTWQ